MSVYVTDTHPIVWYAGGKHSNLSTKALAVFEAAKNEQAFIYIPSPVLWEVGLLERAGRIKLNDTFLRWSETLLKHSGFAIAPLEPSIIAQAVGYNFNSDPFDCAIVATAAELSLPLITKDVAITNSNLVDIWW
jgi:PIN domain nuclease of toxin-antitoxin system